MSNSTPVVRLGVDISKPYDGLYYGFVFSCILFGITFLQGWIYFTTNKDGWFMRILVAGLILADLTTTILDIQIAHHYVIANFGNLGNLLIVSVSFSVEFALTTVVVLVVELFFASRVYLLHHKNKLIPGVIVFTAVASFVSGLVTDVDQFKHDSALLLGITRRRIEIGFMNGFSALSDIITTIAMSWTLFRSRSGIKRTDMTLKNLLIHTITRGVLVAVVQTLLLVLYCFETEKLYWMTPHLCLNKLYVITMVAMLNSRKSLKAKLGEVVTDSTVYSGSNSHSHSAYGYGSSSSAGGGTQSMPPMNFAARSVSVVVPGPQGEHKPIDLVVASGEEEFGEDRKVQKEIVVEDAV